MLVADLTNQVLRCDHVLTQCRSKPESPTTWIFVTSRAISTAWTMVDILPWQEVFHIARRLVNTVLPISALSFHPLVIENVVLDAFDAGLEVSFAGQEHTSIESPLHVRVGRTSGRLSIEMSSTKLKLPSLWVGARWKMGMCERALVLSGVRLHVDRVIACGELSNFHRCVVPARKSQVVDITSEIKWV